MDLFPLISFFTGVISILSPCILPILPIFIGFSLNSKTKTELISFTLGLFSIFTVIIFLTAFFTAIVYQYITYIRIISSILLLIIGILMLVNYSFNFNVKPINHEGIIGSFALGFLTSVAWVPCYSAYLISLISLLVTSADPLFVAFNIVLYCLGFGLTLLALSFIISKINLESFVKKTSFIPKIFAVLIIVSAIYMLFF
ncbi:MAG: cytochrome C biogenesis protein [Methanobrevibacter sp.]|nr:cytochrome C biogenesis protein [Methanobrevibacter sp.]